VIPAPGLPSVSEAPMMAMLAGLKNRSKSSVRKSFSVLLVATTSLSNS
jgi:hypothetical protein